MATKRRGHGEGNVRQRPDGLWEARVSLPGGKRKSLYGKTRREAQDALRAALRDLDAGLDFAAGRQTVGQFLDQWLSASVKPSVKTKTYEGYESIVRVRVTPRIGQVALARLTPLDLQGLYANLEETGLSRRSIHHTHRALHRAFGQAVRWGILPRNPCDGVTPPQPKRPEMRVLNQQQAAALLDVTRDHPAFTLYVLAITTGMRIGELLGLRWDDIDTDASKLVVRRALQRQNQAGLVFVEPKNEPFAPLDRTQSARRASPPSASNAATRTAAPGWGSLAGSGTSILQPNWRTSGSKLAASGVLRGVEAGQPACNPLP